MAWILSHGAVVSSVSPMTCIFVMKSRMYAMANVKLYRACRWLRQRRNLGTCLLAPHQFLLCIHFTGHAFHPTVATHILLKSMRLICVRKTR